LHKKYARELTNIYLSDMNNILNGLVNIQDAIHNSITVYLHNNMFISIGGKLDIDVATKKGNILYPATYQKTGLDNFKTDPAKLAEKNFEILNEGIDLNVDIKIFHYSILAIALLFFYILIFLGSFYGYYRKISAKIRLDDLQKIKEMNRLHEVEKERLKKIDQLSEERELLLSEYNHLELSFKKKQSLAEKNEEDLFDEIDTLEKKLKEIGWLKEKIQKLESNRQATFKQKEKAADKLGKRFRVLYKNIEISNKAIGSLTDMTEEMSLKAEEVINQLNSDPSLVSVKRKVFSKKGKTTSFEVVFSYNGRLYFRKTNGNRIEIPVIGTKNTQEKDLIFLDKIV